MDEASGTASIRIVRTGSLENEVKITYGVSGDTATAGQDFTGGFGTITMPSGVAEVTVNVPILNDNLAEATETFVVSIVDVEGGTIWAPRTARISILDDENPAPPPAQEPPLVSNYTVERQIVVNGLDQPINIEPAPFDSTKAYVAEKGGVIKLVDFDTGASSTVLDLSAQVNSYQDRGLLDIALHPDLANNPYLYAFYVVDPPDTAGKTGGAAPDGGGNRYSQVVRFTLDASTGYSSVVPGSGTVLVGGAGTSLNDISGQGRDDYTNPAFSGRVSSERYLPAGNDDWVINGLKQDYIKVDSASHAGGSLAFGPDGALYISTGDGTSFDYADPRTPDVQSIDSLAGKILRVDPMTGDGLPDNPFVSDGMSLDSNAAKVYQLGLRNPFSISFDGEGRLFMTNTGWNSYEMVYMGGPGANFGWPYYEGGDGGTLDRAPDYQNFPGAAQFYAGVENGSILVTPAFRAFSHDSSDPGFQVQAITGGQVIYTGDKYPAELQNDYFFFDFAGGEVYTLDTNDRTKVGLLALTNGEWVPINYVQMPDGYVYYADIAYGQIGRLLIGPAGGGGNPGGGTGGTTTIGSGTASLVLKISQDAWSGNAQYTIKVDGVQIGGILTAAALHGSGASDTITVLGNWATGPHNFTVTFLNDGYGGTAGTDRNLYIDGATYNGAAVSLAGADTELKWNRGETVAFTDTGGTGGGNPGGGTGGTTTIGSGTDSLVLKISQDAWNGSAQYRISVDGVQIGGILTATALHGSGASDTITVLGNWATGAHNFTVTFLNDDYGGTAGTDRNLYIDGATYNGAAVSLAGADTELKWNRGETVAFTDTGGTGGGNPGGGTGGTTTIGSGTDSLVLKISQDAWSGNAQYTISVDGVQIGGILTATALHGSGASDTVTVLGNWAAGAHNVSITFLNDDYGGVAGTDRNLYIDGATYNGAAVSLAGADPDLMWNRTETIGFTDTGGTGGGGNPGGGTGGTTTIGSGTDSLVLKISQDAWNGSAQYRISVDGVQIGGILTATALHGSGASDTITVLGNWATGAHNFTVTFLNDDYGGTAGTDRNLYIDGATYNGAAVSLAGADTELKWNRGETVAFTDTGGTGGGNPGGGTGGTTTIGSGTDSLVLKISQDAWSGNAQYTISVDGVQIGGILTATALHGSGASDTVTVLGNWAAGAHNVSITFLNDDYGGVAGTDRNLYIDGAPYNGAAVSLAGADPDLMWYRTETIGFTDTGGTGGGGNPGGGTGGTTTIGSGTDSLVLKISQDAWNGSAQYRISVDGVQIGGILTATALHGSGASDTITVLGNWATGAHNFTVTFLNDDYGGTAGTDRNLYIDGATYNGTALSLAGADTELRWNRGETVAFTDTGGTGGGGNPGGGTGT
ncbi:PQQ-dependent sugar dehydrogenase, partial [Siccirubricoccus sp. KC 17139]|nr:PQQ-dependent sugar dehydrogenase [Siccirubricoccus soli]MCP2681591.1 PQQ-dependent sugar dehydrogenase [Siccirubricoccus soli]